MTRKPLFLCSDSSVPPVGSDGKPFVGIEGMDAPYGLLYRVHPSHLKGKVIPQGWTVVDCDASYAETLQRLEKLIAA